MHRPDESRKPAGPVEDSILRARSGSFSALGQILDLYRDYLLRIANDELSSSLVPKVAPSDLVQETCLQAARDFPAFTGGSESELRAWLRQILIHTLRDQEKRYHGTQKRDASREVSLDARHGSLDLDPLDMTRELPSPDPSPSSVAAAGDELRSLRQAMLDLSDDARRAVELRSFEGRSFEEIGRELGRSAEAARKLWSRAVEKLAAEVGNDDTFQWPRNGG